MIDVSYLESGSTVRVVPIGLLCSVRYNDNGVLSKVSLQEESSCNESSLPVKVVVDLQKRGILPSRFPNVKSCTVNGVFTSEKLTLDVLASIAGTAGVENMLLDVLDGQVVRSLSVNDIKFVAYDVDSKVQQTYSPYQQLTSMSLMGLETCDSFVMSPSVNTNKIRALQAMKLYPYVRGYFVIYKSDKYFVDSAVQYYKVRKVDRYVNKLGYIYGNVYTEQGDVVSVPYTAVVRNGVKKGCCIAVDDGVIQDSYPSSNVVDNEFKCQFCGASVRCPSRGHVRCPNPNCTSNMYPNVEHLLATLNLPAMSYDSYVTYVKAGSIQALCDVFSVEPYSSCVVSCTLSTLLNAVCPPGTCRDSEFFEKFVKGAGSMESSMYYLANPSSIEADMGSLLNSMDVASFREWISNDENLLQVKTFVEDIPNVVVEKKSVNLDVPSILRGQRICLQGKFRRGSYEFVYDLLEAFGAAVLTSFDNTCTAVVVGSVDADFYLNGSQASLARSYNVPVYLEDAFFAHYEMDNDLNA